MKKTKIVLLSFIGIILLAVFLRFYRLQTNFLFGVDQMEDSYRLVEIYQKIKTGDFKSLPLKGEPGTFLINSSYEVGGYPVYTGVFYFYLLLPIAIILSFSPYYLTSFFALVSVVSVIFVYLSAREIFDQKTGLIAALLFASLYRINIFARAIWTPSLIPFFVIVLVYLLILIKKRQKTNLWPLFAFMLSAMTQIHNSGYFYAFMLLVMVFVVKPKFPKNILQSALVVLFFILPILPTVVYESTTGFKFLPSILSALIFQYKIHQNVSNSNLVLQFLSVLVDIFKKFWESWVSIIDPWHFDAVYGDVYGIVGKSLYLIFDVIAVSSLLYGMFWVKKGQLARLIYFVFLIVFIPLPFIAKYYYGDQMSGLAFGGAVFSILGAIPFVLIFVSSFLGNLIGRNKIQTLLAIFFILVISLVNIFTVNHNIFNNKEQRFDYGDKKHIVELISKDINDKSYDITIKDPPEEILGFVYLFDYLKVIKPTALNGKSKISTSSSYYYFSGEKPQLSYLVVGNEYWDGFKIESKWQELLEYGRFRVYRAVN